MSKKQAPKRACFLFCLKPQEKRLVVDGDGTGRESEFELTRRKTGLDLDQQEDGLDLDLQEDPE
ncbi:hypothetical protein [Capillibacterium thermochitinicola]|uniref:hypothetical protein n=1 Tax=Capillibacterium thermochitinicola TaxID=2699427 RepID=UPI001E43BE42|nr:hypothetical protein [Capillibacterium thermochitinicola]